MKNKIDKFLFTVLLLELGFLGNSNAFAAEIPSNVNLDYGGIINTHDMTMLKERERLSGEQKDFQNFQNRKNNEEESVINDNNEVYDGKVEKVYNAETSKKLKEKQQNTDKTKKTRKKKFFISGKNKIKQPEIIEEQTENTPSAVEETHSYDDRVFIKSVAVTYSSILTDYEIQSLTDTVTDKYVTFQDLEKLVENFNYLYASKGYVTAHAFLPPQTITDNKVRITLVEGVVGNVTINNNKYTSSNYIKKRINIKKGDIFQIINLEQNIVAFNNYNSGIRLKANLNKGAVEGTTDVNITAEEKFPFRVTALADNAGRKTIGEYRGGLMLQADSLFKQRDRLTIGSYVSRHSVTPFADYNIPVNKKDGRIGFMFSSSYAEIGEGPYKMFDISSRSYNYSLYYTHPLIRKPKFELTSYTAANYKEASTSFFDYRLNTDQITSFETALSARYDTERGIWYLNQGIYQAFPIFDDTSKYFKYTGSIIRLHDFGHGIIGQFKGVYQYSPKDIMPYIDQFQAGGIATVRGYSEGLLIGRSGYVLSAELMFPILPKEVTVKKNKEKIKIPFLGQFVKGLFFVDHAGVYPYKGEGFGARSYNKNDYVTSTGAGLRVTLPGDATARLYWGYPITTNSNETYVRRPRFSFEVSLTPDFDKLLKMKKQREENNIDL